MAKSSKSGGKNLLKGLSNHSPKGDSGMRPKGPNVSAGATRDSVGKGHSLGGRVA